MRFIFALLLLLFAYVGIGLAPLFLVNLKDLSPFTLAFFRFFGSAVLEFGLIIVILILLKYKLGAAFQRALKLNTTTDGTALSASLSRPLGFWDLTKSTFRGYYFASNSSFLKGRNQLTYLAIMGIMLVSIHVPFYYLSFTITGVAVTTIGVDGLAILLVAVYNWLRKEEAMDLLKGIYLMLILAAIITMGFAQEGAGASSIPGGTTTILIAVASYTFFLANLGNDNSHSINLLGDQRYLVDSDPSIKSLETVLKAAYKLFGIHLIGAIFLFPVAGLFSVAFPTTIAGTIGRTFFSDLLSIPSILSNPSIIALILLSTAIPYFLIIYTSVIWPRQALKHNLWAGVFSMVEPAIGLYLGWLVWGENIHVDYIAFITIFLAATILIR